MRECACECVVDIATAAGGAAADGGDDDDDDDIGMCVCVENCTFIDAYCFPCIKLAQTSI